MFFVEIQMMIKIQKIKKPRQLPGFFFEKEQRT